MMSSMNQVYIVPSLVILSKSKQLYYLAALLIRVPAKAAFFMFCPAIITFYTSSVVNFYDAWRICIP